MHTTPGGLPFRPAAVPAWDVCFPGEWTSPNKLGDNGDEIESETEVSKNGKSVSEAYIPKLYFRSRLPWWPSSPHEYVLGIVHVENYTE